MNGKSTVILLGNLCRDPEVRETKSGKKYAVTSIAVNYGPGMETNEGKSVDYFNLKFWNKNAETAEKYFYKGQPLYVEGTIHMRKYTGRDGVEKETNDVTVNSFAFLPDPRRQSSQREAQPQPRNQSEDSPNNWCRNSEPQWGDSDVHSVSVDDLPF